MNFSFEMNISAITVFFQGLLSFFSPCVLPLVPLYISYFSGGAKKVDEDGTIHYPRKRIMLHTLSFVLGISVTFFLLGFGFTALGQFFSENRVWFSRIGGIVMILFGLYQLDVFRHSSRMDQEHRLPFRIDRLAMSPLTAFLMGFLFSFSWTPCVGPVLSSVLLMAGSADTAVKSFFLIAVYTLGFVLPFLAVGLFTGSVLEFFKKHKGIVRYTVKIGGVLILFMGVMTLTGSMNGLTAYLSDFPSIGQSPTGQNGDTRESSEEESEVDNGESGIDEKESGANSDETGIGSDGPEKDNSEPGTDADGTEKNSDEPGTGSDGPEKNSDEPGIAGEESEASSGEPGIDEEESEANGGKPGTASDGPEANSDEPGTGTEETEAPDDEDPRHPAAPDFTLLDQYGAEHTLSDYQGKTIFLNFWATWCPPCRSEMPEIQSLYEKYGKNEEDLVVLGVATPNVGREGSEEEITAFLSDNGYTFPVVMDLYGILSSQYGISAYPTTFMIDSDGKVYGYVEGALTGEIMESIVQQTMDSKKEAATES